MSGPKRHRDTERQRHVGDQCPSETRKAEGRAQNDSRQHRSAKSEPATTPSKGRKHRQPGKKRRGKSGGPIVHSEQVVTSSHDPVSQWRLIEIWLVLQSRRRIVTGLHHQEWDFGVPSLFGLQKWI